MTDTPEIARIRAALAAGPTPGAWFVQYGDDGNHMCMTAICTANKRSRNDGQFSEDELLVAVTMHQSYPFVDPDCNRDEATSEHIAACNPPAMSAVLAHIDAQAAEIAALRADAARYTPLLADAHKVLKAHQEYGSPTLLTGVMAVNAIKAIEALLKEQP